MPTQKASHGEGIDTGKRKIAQEFGCPVSRETSVIEQARFT